MRTLLFILLPFLASGQIYVDSYKFAAPQELLLDAYPGAAAAYSLRLLDKDYTGDCITVRRKSDNALDTFGFVNNYLDTTSLKSFCGTGATDTCWVRIWFDQSGNARKLEQTTNANQPIILASGAVIVNSGKPSILSNGTTTYMASAAYTIPSTISGFAVWRNVESPQSDNYSTIINQIDDNFGTNDAWAFGDNDLNKVRLVYNTGSAFRQFAESLNYNTNIRLNSFIQSSTTVTAYFNGTSFGSSSSKINAVSKPIGLFATSAAPGGNSVAYIKANAFEFVIYGSDQSSNRTGIESNINAFYSIY